MRHRHLDTIGLLVLGGIAVGAALGPASGSAVGADTPRGRAFADRWRYPGFRHAFRVVTLVWGVVFLAEAVAQVVIIQRSSTGTAKTTSNVMPLFVGGLLVVWNISYAKRGRRKGDLAEQAARARGEAPPAMPT